jgi:copper transport protein
MDAGVLSEAAPKAALYASVQLAVGVATTHWLLRRVATSAWRPGLLDQVDRRLARLAIWASVAATAALALRVWSHTAIVFGWPESMTWSNLRVIALESRWGSNWQMQAAAAAVLLLAAIGLRSRRRLAWILLTTAAVVMCGSIPLLGHAAGSAGRMLIHVSHVLGSGLWLGTLAAIAVLCLRADADDTQTAAAALVRGFSPIALSAAATVAASGSIAAVLYLGSFSSLVTTSYGLTLLLKLGLVAAVAACGRSNWQRARSGQPPATSMLALELVFAALVVATTSGLTELEHP